MTPIIDRGSSLPDGLFKFVREGEIIGYGDTKPTHSEIAKALNIGQQEAKTVRIDDGGYITVAGDEITTDERTIKCALNSYDFDEYRPVTVNLLARLTGKKVRNR